MLISELIEQLAKIKAEEGDLNVCLSENHDYWGSLQHYLREDNIGVYSYAQPKGPKSGETEKALVFWP